MHASFKSYIIGFLACLVLTLAAYFAVVLEVPVTLWVITGLAIVQFTVQILFFLHLGHGKDGRFNFISFFLAFGAMFILIAGSLWIMKNLNYNHMPSAQDIMKDEMILK